MSGPNGCFWVATTNSEWIDIISGISGFGNGTVKYDVSKNTGSSGGFVSGSIYGSFGGFSSSGIGFSGLSSFGNFGLGGLSGIGSLNYTVGSWGGFGG